MTTSKNLKPEQVASMNEIIEHNQALLQELNTGVHSPAAIRAGGRPTDPADTRSVRGDSAPLLLRLRPQYSHR